MPGPLLGLRFKGETGTHYNYFRDYDPAIGRYVQSDPIGLKGGFNTFGYVDANPLDGSDPTGEANSGPRKKPKFFYTGCSDTQILRCVETCRAKGQIYQDCTQTYARTPGVKPNPRFVDYTCVCKDKDDGDSKPACGENCKKMWATIRDASGAAILFGLMCLSFVLMP